MKLVLATNHLGLGGFDLQAPPQLDGIAGVIVAMNDDWKGGDGWITPETYPAIEADGIAGSAGIATVDIAHLAEDLNCYSASMGPVNHDLVMAHHRAGAHAQELIGLLERLVDPPPRPSAPLQEMARLVRLEWRARGDAFALARENTHLRDVLTASEQDAAEAREEARKCAEGAARQVGETRRAYESTRSWRLTRPLRALGRVGRRGRGRPPAH